MKKKKAWRYHHFTHVYKQLSDDPVRYGAQQIDGETDGRTDRKSDIEVGVPQIKKNGKRDLSNNFSIRKIYQHFELGMLLFYLKPSSVL